MKRLERIAFAVGLALLIVYGAARQMLEHARGASVAAFLEHKEATLRDAARSSRPLERSLAESSHRTLSIGAPDPRRWSIGRIEAFQGLAPTKPLGVLRIPSLALEVPIHAGTHALSLDRGAGLIEGTASLGAEGNTGLAAHRDGFFRALQDVGVGDLLEIETLTAKHAYRVSDIRIVVPSAVEVLAATDRPVVTLVTCYPFYFVGPAPRRFVVRAERIQR